MASFDTSSEFLNVLPTGDNAREFLKSHHWTNGLQNRFVLSLKKIGVRFFVCDDSGSMLESDGNRTIIETNGEVKLEQCTRWQELTNTAAFHIAVSRLAHAPSSFFLLNEPINFTVGSDQAEDTASVNKFINTSPGGRTPICGMLGQIHEKILPLADILRGNGQLASIVILTDGEPTDGDILEALTPFEDLPVWIVIRLCTNDQQILDYWNKIDENLELNIEVLADLNEESLEVFTYNPWLTYCEPLHKLREFGIPLKEFDMLDECPLSLDQIRLICSIIFGGKEDDYPHPEACWDEFIERIGYENGKQSVWSPLSQAMRPWIDMEALLKLRPGF